MNINIKATGIELTPAIIDYVNKKVSSVEKYLDNKSSISTQVEVGKISNRHKSGDIFRAEVNMNYDGINIYASKKSADLYSAIDLVEAEVSKKVVKEKGRHIKLLRQGQRAIKYMTKGIIDTTLKGYHKLPFTNKNE